MMALSIRQPWAWLILHGGKDIENRDWPTKFRGRFLLHAAKTMTREDYDSAGELYEKFRRMRDGEGLNGDALPALPFFDNLERGGFVGSVELVGCATMSTSPWFFGAYGYVLREPRYFSKLVPYPGRLNFFEVNTLALYDQLREAGAVL